MDDLSTMSADIAARLERLIAAAKRAGREEALSEVRALVGGASGAATVASAPVARGRRGRKPAAAAATAAPAGRSKKKRKNPWAGLSPEARLVRVNAIRRGRGLPLIQG